MGMTPVQNLGRAAELAGIRVALVGEAIELGATLEEQLLAGRRSTHERWEVGPAAQFEASDAAVDIAICFGAADTRTARLSFPNATVFALLAAREQSDDVVAALHNGAHVCVRSSDPILIGAYLRSIARRRGQLDAGRSMTAPD